MGITKPEVAEREIVAAVTSFFDGGDSVPIYVLASAACRTAIAKQPRRRPALCSRVWRATL